MEKEITIREKITIRLVIFLIQLLKPFEYEHQFKEFFNEIKELVGVKLTGQN